MLDVHRMAANVPEPNSELSDLHRGAADVSEPVQSGFASALDNGLAPQMKNDDIDSIVSRPEPSDIVARYRTFSTTGITINIS